MSTVIVSSLEPGIAHLQLSRPERRNALAPELVGELHDAHTEIARDRSVRVVILSGAGKGFCAGADLKGGPRREPESRSQVGIVYDMQAALAELMLQIRELENRTQVLGTFTGNMEEAMKAFQAGRAPVWKPL